MSANSKLCLAVLTLMVVGVGCGEADTDDTDTDTGRNLVITGSWVGAANGGCSPSAFTVTVENDSGQPVNVTQDTVVSINSDQSQDFCGSAFYLTSDCSGGAVTSITITSGTSSGTFYYADGDGGTPTLSASSDGFTTGTLQIGHFDSAGC